MAQCDPLFTIIDGLYERYLDFWEAVCSIESPTTYKPGVDACGDYFARAARALGFKVEICRQEVAGNMVCISMNDSADAAPIIFSGHIDTVHPVGSFGTPAVRRDENNIYGPGVLDCKGGCVAGLMAMEALRDAGFTARPVYLILQSDEEKNSNPSGKDTLRFMREKSQNAVAFLNLESAQGDTATLERKGILQFRFHILGKEIHSSKCMDGASAIAEAAHKIIYLEQAKDKETLSCNCGIISGGTAVNTVARECEFYADFRYSTEADLVRAREMVSEAAGTTHVPGCSCEVTETSHRPAMEKAARNYALLDTLNGIWTANGLPEIKARKSPGGSDAAYITQYGIPCIDCIGPDGSGIHTMHEYSILASLKKSAKQLASAAYCI